MKHLLLSLALVLALGSEAQIYQNDTLRSIYGNVPGNIKKDPHELIREVWNWALDSIKDAKPITSFLPEGIYQIRKPRKVWHLNPLDISIEPSTPLLIRSTYLLADHLPTRIRSLEIIRPDGTLILYPVAQLDPIIIDNTPYISILLRGLFEDTYRIMCYRQDLERAFFFIDPVQYGIYDGLNLFKVKGIGGSYIRWWESFYGILDPVRLK